MKTWGGNTHTYMKPDLIKIERLLKTRKTINLNNKLARTLGYDDMRDLFTSIYQWGNTKDFTYQNTEYDMQRFLRAYLRETYID